MCSQLQLTFGLVKCLTVILEILHGVFTVSASYVHCSRRSYGYMPVALLCADMTVHICCDYVYLNKALLSIWSSRTLDIHPQSDLRLWILGFTNNVPEKFLVFCCRMGTIHERFHYHYFRIWCCTVPISRVAYVFIINAHNRVYYAYVCSHLFSPVLFVSIGFGSTHIGRC
jgi:hypothetical protein